VRSLGHVRTCGCLSRLVHGWGVECGPEGSWFFWIFLLCVEWVNVLGKLIGFWLGQRKGGSIGE